MISPQYLINTGICGLFCATLFSMAATKPATKPVVLTRPLPIAQDYTLHIKTSKVERHIYTPVLKDDAYKRRTIHQRNQQAREKRRQIEQLFTHSSAVRSGETSTEVSTVIIAHPEEPSAILKRARNAVHRSIDVSVNEDADVKR